MARYKTPEEIEADKKLFAERYPEKVQSSTEDPTQPFRNLIKNAIASTDTPIGNSFKEEPKKEFEMSPEIKKYGYDLFGIKDLAGDVEQEIPFAPKEVPSVEEKIPSTDIKSRQPASIVERPQKEIPKIEPQKPIQQEPEKTITPISPVQTEQQSDIEKLIKQSEEEQDRAGLWKQSAKLRDAIMGAGLGKIKQTDVSMYEDLEKKAQRPIQNLLLKQELEDKQAQRDPNSNISKLMRKSLEDLGMNMSGLEGVPYSQLEKLYPALTQSLYTKIAAEAKKEENFLRRIEKAEAAAAKKENIDFNKYQKVAVGIDRLKSNMERSDTYKSYLNANDAFIALDEALSSKDPNAKIQSSAAFMKFAKSAQGDSSVVRSEDMKVLAGGLNLSPKQLIDKFTANLEGKKFSSGELQTMKKVIQTIIDIKKKQLNKDHLQPIQKRAQANDYDLSESISPDFIRDIQGDQTPSTEEESNYTPKQEAGIKAYMESKKISREEAIKRLKTGGRL